MNNKKRKIKRQHKKRKPKLSKEYVDTELEVSNLLKSKKLTTESNQNIITIETEIDFFTTGLKTEDNVSPSDSIKQSSSVESTIDRDVQSSPAEQSVYTIHPASSYIQIDETSPIKKFDKVKVLYNDGLHYYPSDKDISNIPENIINIREDGVYVENRTIEKTSNMIKMVNRLNEEGKFDLISSQNYIKYQSNFSQNDNELYKTEENDTIFKPIFYLLPLAEMQGQLITSRKLLTITLKELKFLVHPLQTEEHHLERKLENIFEAYTIKVQQNLIIKIKLELDSVREIIKNLLNAAEEDDFEKIENYTKTTKFLRKKLHREELSLKTLIQNALDVWIALKKIRKNQGYNYTDFKLTIKVEEVDAEEDELLWNERYKTELNEILREQFEKYYKDKRIRKSKKVESVEKLQPLRKPGLDLIKIDVEETLRNCTRQPGEPKIELFCSKLEDRCRNLEKFKDYYMHIVFDGQFVGASKHFKLNSDFLIDINQSFGIYLEKNIPKNMKIEIYEKSKLSSSHKICKINIPFEITIDYTGGHTESIEFSSTKENISGILKVIIFSETELYSEENLTNIRDKKPTMSKEIVKTWYDNYLINPLDPDCVSLVDEYNEKDLKTSPIDSITNKETFDLNENLLAFCSQNEIENNTRFNMLRARHCKDMKYKHLKFIPLYNNEIETASEDNVLDEGNWMDIIDLQKHKGKKYLRKLYDVILNHCAQLKKDEDASNLLLGDEPPTLRTIFSSIMNFFGPSRPFNLSKTSQSVSQMSSNTKNFNLVINVVRATGVPIRNFNPPVMGRRSSSVSTNSEKQTLKYGNVKPYVCINFKDKIVRTTSAEGSNPTWNEQLVLQITENITDIKEDLKFQIFDEYIEDLLHDDNTRSMEVYQRIHANWLGEYQIPIATIFHKQQIEGVFELNIPKLIIGYIKPSIEMTTDENIPIENFVEIRDAIHLWLYISIEPQFEANRMNASCLECSELKEVKNQIQEWCIQIKELCPVRFLDPLICIETGKRICATRLLESIPLPIDKYENMENYIRRYVSLIPVIRTTNDCLGLNGVWLSNQTLLDTTWGSSKDLCILLACFYMNLGIRCSLVLGIAYPYGETAYVLLQENNNYILIDAGTGKKYYSKDVYCPLQSVKYIISQDNIYCNLQREERVSMTDFNTQDTSLWIPLFGKNNPAPIGGVHNLNYKFRNCNSIHELRKNIERKIMKKISTWRSTRKTIWNRAYSHILYDILSNLEQDVTLEHVSENYIEIIAREIPNYKLFGFTLNFPYTNLSSISKMIRSTGIHFNTDKNVEFAVSVYIHQYPNNILSCWIFLLSFTPLT